MLQGISTQEAVTVFKNQLELMASNLNFHVNDSLSEAHGVELIYGYIDGSGNDLRTYQDSYGSILSSTDVTKPNFIRFCVNGVFYYAPANVTGVDPGPQPAGTGSIQLTPQSSAITETSLITNYITYEAAAASGINALLLNHTLLQHMLAHGTLAVTTANTYSASNAVAARNLLFLNFLGNVYTIPCDTRLGGPPQVQAQMSPLSSVVINSAHHDPVDNQVTLAGAPGITYNLLVKVRGITEAKPYVADLGPGHGAVLSVAPVPPALTTQIGVFQFTGTPSGNNEVYPGSTVDEVSMIVSNPSGFYCLNYSAALSGGSRVADYLFTFQATTGATITLITRTIDGTTNNNDSRLEVTDNVPPLQPGPAAAQGTINHWMEVDAIQITPV